jgi:hypothetical protein
MISAQEDVGGVAVDLVEEVVNVGAGLRRGRTRGTSGSGLASTAPTACGISCSAVARSETAPSQVRARAAMVDGTPRIVTVRSVTSTSRRTWSRACSGTRRLAHRRIRSIASSGITRDRRVRVRRVLIRCGSTTATQPRSSSSTWVLVRRSTRRGCCPGLEQRVEGRRGSRHGCLAGSAGGHRSRGRG